MAEIVWEAPPPTRHGRQTDLVEFAAALRERVGEWARYPRPLTDAAASAQASRINAGHGAFADPGSYEAVTRTIDGRRILFVRYTGQSEAGAA